MLPEETGLVTVPEYSLLQKNIFSEFYEFKFIPYFTTVQSIF